MNNGYKLQTASDIQRDGLGVELYDKDGEVIVEVFRKDSDNTFSINTFDNDVPVDAIEMLLKYAHYRLQDFEDGTPLSKATNFGRIEQSAVKRISDIFNNT